MNNAADINEIRNLRRTRFATAIGAALAAATLLTACTTPTVPRISGSASGPATDADGDSTTASDDGGRLPGKVAVTDDRYAAVANLKPELQKALNAAAADASERGLEILVNSGWRSVDYQNELLNDAVAKYGSKREAAKWVSTPEKSAHVSGDAVDIGPMPATDWLSQRGAKYGLCQTYANESWHYELRPQAKTNGCPAMYADPTEDPRLA